VPLDAPVPDREDRQAAGAEAARHWL
jgi:hypothetical protein